MTSQEVSKGPFDRSHQRLSIDIIRFVRRSHVVKDFAQCWFPVLCRGSLAQDYVFVFEHHRPLLLT